MKTSTGVTLLDFANRNGNATLAEALTYGRRSGRNPRAIAIAAEATSLPARAAVESVLPALQRADVAFIEEGRLRLRSTTSPRRLMTIASARAGGRGRERADREGPVAENCRVPGGERRGSALENNGLPGGVDTVSYILLGLSAAGHPGDPVTDAWARYVRSKSVSGWPLDVYSTAAAARVE